MIEIEGPDGVIYEFPAGTDDATIKTALSKVYGAPQAPQAAPQAQTGSEAAQPQERGFWQRVGDNVIGFDDGVTSPGEKLGRAINDLGTQFLGGVNEGIADIAAAPVELTTGAVNLGTTGINALAGTSIPQITDPVGGSRDMQAVMSPFVTAPEPQGMAQRFSRSIGRDTGASAVPALGMASRAQAPANALLTTAQSAFGSGAAAQAAREVTDNQIVEILAGLVGGAAPIARQRTPRPQVATRGELRDGAEALYERGRARAGADPASVGSLRQQVNVELQANSRITPTGRVLADGNVKKYLDVLDDFDQRPMSPGEMQNVRSFLQDAAASADAGERRMGAVLLRQFDDWRGQHVPEFREADAIYARAKRAEDVDYRIEKAERRADSTGTGGNAVNTARQNIRQILDNPKARRGYTAEEIAAMEDIVRGTPSTNALRLLGRLSPTSGALPLMGNIAGVGVAPGVGMAAMGAASGAKGLSEILTNRQINALSELIRNGGPLPAMGLNEGQTIARNALAASTASR